MRPKIILDWNSPVLPESLGEFGRGKNYPHKIFNPGMEKFPGKGEAEPKTFFPNGMAQKVFGLWEKNPILPRTKIPF